MKFNPQAMLALKPGAIHVGPEEVWARPERARMRAPQLLFSLSALELIITDYLNGSIDEAESGYERRCEALLSAVRDINAANVTRNPRSYYGWFNILARTFQSSDQIAAAIDAFVFRNQEPKVIASADGSGSRISIPAGNPMFDTKDGVLTVNRNYKSTKPASAEDRKRRAAWALMLGILAVYSLPNADGGPLGQDIDFFGDTDITYDWWSLCDTLITVPSSGATGLDSLKTGRLAGAVSSFYVTDVESAISVEYFGRLAELCGSPSVFAGDSADKSSLLGILKYWVKRRLAKERGASVSDAVRDASLMPWASVEQAIREVLTSSPGAGKRSLKDDLLVLPDARDAVYLELGAQYIQQVKQFPERVISNADRFALFTQTASIAELTARNPLGKLNWIVYGDVLETLTTARGSDFGNKVSEVASRYASQTYRGSDAKLQVLATIRREDVLKSMSWPVINVERKAQKDGFRTETLRINKFITDEPVEFISYPDAAPVTLQGLAVDTSFTDVPSYSTTFLEMQTGKMGLDGDFATSVRKGIQDAVELLEYQVVTHFDRGDFESFEDMLAKDNVAKDAWEQLRVLESYQPFSGVGNAFLSEQDLRQATVSHIFGDGWKRWFGIFLDREVMTPYQISILRDEYGLEVTGRLKDIPVRIVTGTIDPSSDPLDAPVVAMDSDLIWLLTDEAAASTPRRVVPLIHRSTDGVTTRGTTVSTVDTLQAVAAGTLADLGFIWTPYYAGYEGNTLLNTKPGDNNGLRLLSGGEILGEVRIPNLLWSDSVLSCVVPFSKRKIYSFLDRGWIRGLISDRVRFLAQKAMDESWLRGTLHPLLGLITTLGDGSRMRLQMMNPSVRGVTPLVVPVGVGLMVADLYGEHLAAFYLRGILGDIKKKAVEADSAADSTPSKGAGGAEAKGKAKINVYAGLGEKTSGGKLLTRILDELDRRIQSNKGGEEGQRRHLVIKDYGTEEHVKTVCDAFKKATSLDANPSTSDPFPGFSILTAWWAGSVRKSVKDATPFASLNVKDEITGGLDRLDTVFNELISNGDRTSAGIYIALSDEVAHLTDMINLVGVQETVEAGASLPLNPSNETDSDPKDDGANPKA